MKAKILRDTTIDGLAEKINREFENSKAPFLQQVCTQYKTAVVPKMRGKEIVGHEVEYSALIFIEEVGEAKKPEKEAIRQQESWICRPLSTDPDVERKLEAVEKALGFKLFIWQKTFIEKGSFPAVWRNHSQDFKRPFGHKSTAVGLYRTLRKCKRKFLPHGNQKYKRKTE